MLKVYIGNFNYNINERSFLVDYLKPLIPSKQNKKYDLDEVHIQIVGSITESDCFLLPYSWNYYFKKNKIKLAETFILQAYKRKKKIIIWVSGDYHFDLPSFDNIISLYMSVYQSKKSNKMLSIPVIINDPLHFLERKEIEIASYKKNPIIGFCGHVDSNMIISILKVMRLVWINIKHYIQFSSKYFEPVIPATYLRKKILKILESSNIITTNFIKRKKYKAGMKSHQPNTKQIKKDFFNNIVNSDYTLCIRGTGNFSARFYETLALGRIPVFINTDCALPFSNIIKWNEHVVWVEKDDIVSINTKLTSFHSKLTKLEFIQLQKSNRILWKKYFSYPGFVKQSTKYLIKEINET